MIEMMIKLKLRFLCTLAAAFAVFGSVEAQPFEGGGPPEIILHPPNRSTGFAPTAGSNNKINPTISYHGGPVIGAPNVYVIWYGAWTDNQKLIITDFLNSIGGSPYFNINKTYSISSTPINGLVAYSGAAVSTYIPAGGPTAVLSDQDIQNIVSSSGLPPDANGVYFVLTGSDTRKDGFCTSYCGWHTHAILGGADIKYSFVGNPTACPLAGASVGNCAAQTARSPNGDVGVDAMVSVIAHELEEATTDPDLNAWWNTRNGAENADTCAWTFGSQYIANGAYANMHLGARDFLIQRNLVRVSGANYCVKGLNPNGTLVK
jgi:hypothetical protein